jgi:hypothetical protein
MIIHLEAEWDDAILERFALVIGQQSLHFALQLNWILQGAIEDYQPELPDGSSNPNYNFLFYSRCIKLLTNMERCVVYRKPRSQELQRLYEKGKITKQEFQIMEHADRRFNAIEVTAADEDSEGFGGVLLYKRTARTACYKAKPWKKRYFCIEARMFNCYNSKGGKLVRSMPLEGAKIEKRDHPKYKFLFIVANRSFEFGIRADTQEDQAKWIKVLKEESTSTAVFGVTNASMDNMSEAKERVIAELTAAQRARYEFFRDERDFVRRITDIAEELRFKVPADRKKKAPKLMKHMKIPPCVYVPLCNSTNTWRRVTATLYKDTRVFNTNERCPVIMYFLATRGELPSKAKNGKKNANLDVAEYMHQGFEKYDEETATIKEEPSDIGSDEGSLSGDEAVGAVQAMYGPGGSLSAGGDNPQSSVWHDSILFKEKGADSPDPGNKHLNRFLRDSFVSIPRKIATRLESRRPSTMDTATGIRSVPMEGVIDTSTGRGSIMKQDSKIVLGDLDEGDIDIESINRAKMVVSGGESWAEKSFRMLEEAKHKPENVEMEVVSLMSKSNDDLRQEVFVMQMIHYYKSVFAQAKLPLWLKTYRILSSGSSTGLIEVLVDATSIDGLKKAAGYPKEGGMRKYFEDTYGGPDSKPFKAAQQNFMQSLAAYSLVMYLLGLKDRHNGNIMIDTRGHLIFIDFGFAMGMAPGHEFSMERAPFKFTKEYLEVMGGPKSACYKEFKRIFVEGFKAARLNSQIALGLVEIMMYKSNYPCFSGGRYGNGVSLQRFEKRLMLDVPDKLIEKRAHGLIQTSLDHWGTNLYDGFQQWSNGYAK